MLVLLSIGLGMMAAEAGAYRALDWEWGEALKAVVPSQVTGLVAGIFLMVALERFLLRTFPGDGMAALVGLGLGAVVGGAPVVTWLAPQQMLPRSVFLVSSGVKVLLLATMIAGLFFSLEFRDAAKPPPAPELQPRPQPPRSLKSFSQNNTMY